jgi:hypothetical protein
MRSFLVFVLIALLMPVGGAQTPPTSVSILTAQFPTVIPPAPGAPCLDVSGQHMNWTGTIWLCGTSGPTGTIPTPTIPGQQPVSTGSGYTLGIGDTLAAGLGIICDGATDITTFINGGGLGGLTVRLPSFKTCMVKAFSPPVNNIRFVCDFCTLAHVPGDYENMMFMSGRSNITFDGIIFDENAVNLGSLTGGGTNAATTLLTMSGGSGYRPNFQVPLVSTGGGCSTPITGYFTTDGNGFPQTVHLYSAGIACTSLPTMTLNTSSGGSVAGEGYNSYVTPTFIWSGSAAIKTSSNTVNAFVIQNSQNIVFRNCFVRSTGATIANMLANNTAFAIFNASVSFINCRIENTVAGEHIYDDANGLTSNRLYVENLFSDGAVGNGIFITNGHGNWDLAGGTIQNVLDLEGLSGQNGNAVDIYNADHARVHDFTILNPRYSGVRVSGDGANYNQIYNINLSGNGEVGLWAELGAEFNSFSNIHIDNCNSGFFDANVGNRPHQGKNYFQNIHISGCQAIGASAEHADVINVSVADTPIPFKLGFGGTGFNNIFRGDTCTKSATSTHPVSIENICFGVDRFQSQPSLISGDNLDGVTVARADLEYSFNLIISGITAANPAVISYNPNVDTGDPPVVGYTYLISEIFGMLGPQGQSINGAFCGVSAINTTTHTITCGGVTGVPALNTTGYSAWQYPPPGNGEGALTSIYKNGNTTPFWPAAASVVSTNLAN